MQNAMAALSAQGEGAGPPRGWEEKKDEGNRQFARGDNSAAIESWREARELSIAAGEDGFNRGAAVCFGCCAGHTLLRARVL